jgi:4-hydroxy-tetrahydrodipicolinate synthase
MQSKECLLPSHVLGAALTVRMELDAIVAMVRAALDGDYTAAREMHHKLFALCRDMLSLATNPIPLKAVMRILGRDTGELRLPLTPLEADQERALVKTLADYGLTQPVSA